ncbi:MAG: hypothetical protein O6761_07835 [Thaumarchaeota archaeon]|nr:hypothetical protein [Nitrososphaerota archaeon]
MKTEFVSYQNDQKIKDKYVNRMKLHIQNDELKQRKTGENCTGCLVWCTLDNYSYSQFSKELGVDFWIPTMLDKVFEGMKPTKAQEFSLKILEAIPKGIIKKDTDLIRLKILHFLLTKILPKKYQTKKETAKIISMFEEAIKGVTITYQHWRVAADAAYAAYAAAAYADAYAAYAAAAKQSFFEIIGNKLIELFQEYKNVRR